MMMLRELNSFYHASLTMADIEHMSDLDVKELQQTARLIREQTKDNATE